MIKRSIACVVSTCLFAAMLATPAAADAGRAVAFAENIWPNVNFLDTSSRLAMKRSRSGALRNLARKEAADQTVAANTLVAWIDSVTTRPAAAPRRADGSSLAAAPFRAAAEMSAGMADAIEGLQTGRSVAIDGEAADPAPIRLREIKLEAPTADLDRLSHLHGRAFDRLLKATQRNALSQLSTLYASYIQNGEDAGLRNLAVRQLPKVDAALARLRSL